MDKKQQRIIKELLRIQVNVSNKISSSIEEVMRLQDDEDAVELLSKTIDSISYNMNEILGYNRK